MSFSDELEGKDEGTESMSVLTSVRNLSLRICGELTLLTYVTFAAVSRDYWHFNSLFFGQIVPAV